MSHNHHSHGNPYNDPFNSDSAFGPEWDLLEELQFQASGISELDSVLLSPIGLNASTNNPVNTSMSTLNTGHKQTDKSTKESAHYYLSLGVSHYNNFLTRSVPKDLDIAINCFRRSLEENPTLAEGYVKLASALYDKGELNIETAKAYCNKAIEINPKNKEAYLVRVIFTNSRVILLQPLMTLKM